MSLKGNTSNKDVEIKLVEDHESLQQIFENEFDMDVPSKEQANIVGYYENGQLKAFMVTELLLRVSMPCVRPSESPHKGRTYLKNIIDYLFRSIKPETSVVVFAHEEIHRKIVKRLGFYEVPGEVFRLEI